MFYRLLLIITFFFGIVIPLQTIAQSPLAIQTIRQANNEAQRQPTPSGFTNAIMNYHYVPGGLYEVFCEPLAITDITLEKGEHITSVAAGDTLRWEVAKTYSGSDENYQEHLLIKPTQARVKTNLVITTDRRTYHLQLFSTDNTAMTAISWVYPSLSPIHTRSTIKTQEEMLNNLNFHALNFNYRIQLSSGTKPDWYPIAVFTDGTKTYIEFPHTMQNAPLLYIGNNRETDQIVNYRVAGNFYIVDAVIHTAQLRLISVVQITQGAGS